MSDMILPVGGDGIGSGGAAGLGGAVGAFAGSIFGSVFGGGGWGRGNWGGGDGAAVAAGVGVNALLDSINNVSQSVNNIALQTLQAQSSTNTTVERAASSSTFALTNQNQQNLLASVQGFAGLNTQIQQSGFQTVQAIQAAAVAAAECCCSTKALILQQGCETRELIQANRLQDAFARNVELQAKISNMEQTANLTALINHKIPTPS